MIKATEMGLFETVFTFVDNSGKNYNIASERLDKWEGLKSIEEVLVVIEPMHIKQLLLGKSISSVRLMRLANWVKAGNIPPPIIFGSTGNEEMLISGHHRYLLAFILGALAIPARILKESEWKQFEVEGLKKVSKEELRNIPVI